jgi:hypothetical protein
MMAPLIVYMFLLQTLPLVHKSGRSGSGRGKQDKRLQVIQLLASGAVAQTRLVMTLASMGLLLPSNWVLPND